MALLHGEIDWCTVVLFYGGASQQCLEGQHVTAGNSWQSNKHLVPEPMDAVPIRNQNAPGPQG